MMWRKSWRMPAFSFLEGPTCEVGMFVVSWWGKLVKAIL